MMRPMLFALAAAAAFVLQTTAATEAKAEEETRPTEQLLVKAQKICPVSGKDLTSMGGPVKAKIGEQTIFLCCKGCFGRDVQKQHWAQIQENQRKAQGKCPAMGKPLPEDATSTVVEGRRVFVCCPPCIKKIEADPEKHLAKVDQLLEENLSEGNSQL